MLSPLSTVLVLTVLWLVVVVPMLLQKIDERRGQRSVAKFSGAMRALGRRGSLAALARPVERDEPSVKSQPERTTARAQVFLPGTPLGVTAAARRPVPAAMEAIMYSDRIDKADMSQARRQMMVRRRRSLTVLAALTVVGLGWALTGGGTMAWAIAFLAVTGLGGYLYFLRSQAVRDRDRRANRITRYGAPHLHDVSAADEFALDDMDSLVRIDDDDVELHGMADTIDLTGLYSEELYEEQGMRRAV
jgi:hypothetical protein